MCAEKREPTSNTITQDYREKRVRQIEHIPGNWPSFAYILRMILTFCFMLVPAEENEDQICEIVKQLNSDLGLASSDGFTVLTREKQGFSQFHVSLTKLFFLRDFQIRPFVQSVRKAIRMKPFVMSLSSPQVFTNEDKTRSFCSLLVQHGYSQIVQIIHMLDSVLGSYKKDPYYNPPVPHCTIGSRVGDLSNEAKQRKIYGNEYVEVDYDEEDEGAIREKVQCIYLSIGNQTHEICF